MLRAHYSGLSGRFGFAVVAGVLLALVPALLYATPPRVRRRRSAPPAGVTPPPPPPALPNGNDDPHDPARVCNSGDMAECDSLGGMYLLGRGGFAQDPVRAAQLFTRACDGNYLIGCVHLGLMYEDGNGIPRNPARAAQLFTRACDGGDTVGCNNLGLMYQHGALGISSADDVPHDPARAAQLFTRACDSGNTNGCENVREMSAHTVVNTQLARMSLRACESGNMNGCAHLGFLYATGRAGVPANRVRALEFYQRACTGGPSTMCSQEDENGISYECPNGLRSACASVIGLGGVPARAP